MGRTDRSYLPCRSRPRYYRDCPCRTSVARSGTRVVPSFTESNKRFRVKLIEAGVMIESGKDVVFQKDHLFGSPSMAALALLGRTSNGWLEWKDSQGISLGERERGDQPG